MWVAIDDENGIGYTTLNSGPKIDILKVINVTIHLGHLAYCYKMKWNLSYATHTHAHRHRHTHITH